MSPTMTDLWEDEQFNDKLKRLTPKLQEAFIRALEQIYEQESTHMLSFIDTSREDMKNTAEEIREEQEILRDTAEILAQQRNAHRIMSARAASSRSRRSATHRGYSGRPRQSGRSAAGPRSPHVAVQYEDERLPPLRTHRNREKAEEARKQAERVKPLYTPSVSEGRTSPPPDSPDSAKSLYEEETQEIMQYVRQGTNMLEEERERQTEIVQKKKERKKAEKIERDVAITGELIREASTVEWVKEEEKARQEQKLKERLEKKKKKKSGSVDPLTDGEGELDKVEIEDESESMKKKKKKKKKDKDREDTEKPTDASAAGSIEGDAEAEAKKEKKEKKKKKKKEKNNEDDDSVAVAIEDDEAAVKKEKKKKKKKKEKDVEKVGELEDL